MLRDLGGREESGRHALLLERVQAGGLDWPGRVRLSFEPQPGLEIPGPGDRIRFQAGFKRPQPPTNPGEFDYRGYLLGRGIQTLAGARHRTAPLIEERGGPGLWRGAWLGQARLARGLEAALSPRAAALAKGMLLGETGDLSSHDMSAYARAGLVHLLSVSGLHLALFVALFLWASAKLGLPRKPRAWVAMLLAAGYAFVCGLPVPALRALLLFGLMLLAEALDLDSDAATSLGFGALLILLAQPGALFEAGAQLSFAVSFSLLTLTPLLQARLPASWPRWLSLAVAASLAAEAAAAPLVAWHFSVFYWPSLVATALSAPLMAPIVALGLAAALTGWPLFGWPLERLLGLLDGLTHGLAGLPYAAFSVGRPSALWLLAWLGLLLALPRFGFKRLLPAAAGLALWLLWPGLPWAQRHPGLTKAWFFDVGQGDAALIRFGDGATLLVDAGPLVPDAGSWVVGPALRRLGVQRLDWAVASHAHADHYGGLRWLAAEFPVGELLHGGRHEGRLPWLELLRSALARGVRLRDLAREAPPEAWDGRVAVLGPLKPLMAGSGHDLHNNNVVLRVGDWLLLTGDLEAEGERRLLRSGLLKPSLMLKVAHHGSRTSSGARFLKAAAPLAALIPSGRKNRHGHPSKSALARLKAAGVALYRTDLQGCVAVERAAGALRILPWRAAAGSPFTAPPRRRSAWKSLDKQEGE